MSDWPRYYVLRGRTPFAVDVLTWGKEFEDISKRRIADTMITNSVHVSTVFLGIDHAFRMSDDDKRDPVLFETLVFGGPLDGVMLRYSTYERAERGHEEIVADVRKAVEQVRAIARSAGADQE